MAVVEEVAIELRCGVLRVCVECADLPLEWLCGFASRRSRKRGFVFISKVLGKHYPVRPGVLGDVQARLAAKLAAASLPGPVVFIALAETAVGLGQGIYEHWLRQTSRDDALFLHSTRYHLRRPVALTFEEGHSHATAHLVYEPLLPELRRLMLRAATLVLVDDELTTGRTLANLVRAFRRIADGVRQVHWVALTDWLGGQRRRELDRELNTPIGLHRLLAGSYHLHEDPAFDPGPIPDVSGRGDCKDELLPINYGRLGQSGPLHFDFDRLLGALEIVRGRRILVLGTGEFAHAPFLLAQRLEQTGHDVHFQATTRSPLLVERDLTSAFEFIDNYGDSIPNYVYNVVDRTYDEVLIGYETQPLPSHHTLPSALRGTPIFFPEPS
ncbi:MAG: phosphoribosyltransferase family protein [Gemmataceae bacterium]|nr:phosphoribosyltransferase family protein [Gemmataceae bacterium]